VLCTFNITRSSRSLPRLRASFPRVNVCCPEDVVFIPRNGLLGSVEMQLEELLADVEAFLSEFLEGERKARRSCSNCSRRSARDQLDIIGCWKFKILVGAWSTRKSESERVDEIQASAKTSVGGG
jgi:hypothetical protein